MHTVLRSATASVTIGPDQPFCIIGERINPTGRKKFQEQLRVEDLSAVEIDVAQQISVISALEKAEQRVIDVQVTERLEPTLAAADLQRV